MKVAVKISGSFVALIIIITLIPAFIPDEEYSAGARQWLNDANNPEKVPVEANRFNALVGLYVDVDKDMASEGAKLITDINRQLTGFVEKDANAEQLDAYWSKPPISPSENLSRNTSEAFIANPVQWVLDNQENYTASINSNQVLLNRFRQLMKMEQYSYTMKLDVNAPSISYSKFLAIKRLNNLSIINEFTTTNKNNAIHRLQKNIDFSRLMMKQSSLILDKMIAVACLKIDLMTYSSLLDVSLADNKFNINNLHADEGNMLKAFQGEFAFVATSLDVKNFFSMGPEPVEPGMFEELFIQSYLKPKRMQNNAHNNVWLPFLQLKNEPLASRKIKANAIGEEELTWWQIYQDPIGYVLFAIATPSYFSYLDEIDHIDAMITLLNLKASIYYDKVNANQVTNYLSLLSAEMNAAYTGAQFSWSQNKHELSYEIPGYKNERVPRVKLYINQNI